MREWESFLSSIESEIGADSVEKWLRPLKILRFDAQNLYLESPTPLHQSWFEEQITPYLSQLVNGSGRPIRIHFAKSSKPKSIPFTNSTLAGDPLDPSFTFSTLLSHPGCAVALNLLSQPLTFNPVLLFGPPASGKTHLLMAYAAKQTEEGKKVLYVRAERFTEHVVHAIHTSTMPLFRRLYREVDVLILDGIDALARKFATQEEFFHTFNALHIAGKPILLSSRVAPSRLIDIEPRLISRFEWGLSLSMTPPTHETIVQILLKKAEEFRYPLPLATAEHLATHFPLDPFKALTALMVRSPKGPPTHVDPLLLDLLQSESRQAVTSEKLLEATAHHFGIKVEDLKGKSQARENTFPRQVAIYLCRKKLEMPLQAIGRLLGRDHSTVLSSTRLVEKKIEENEEEVLRSIDEIERRLYRS